MSNKIKVLCYSPYNAWELHGMWEITILHALQLRGSEIKHVLCNGVFKACDMYWDATRPRHAMSCTECQAQTSSLSARMGMPFEGLSKYINTDEYQLSYDYIKKLGIAEYKTAKFGNWEIGEWVKASLHRHFRTDEIDLSDNRVIEVYANYIESALLAAHGLSRIIKEYNPDIMLLFNGSQSSCRVALELAKEKNIDTYLHERGFIHESIWLLKNQAFEFDSNRKYKEVWNKWKNIPLTQSELVVITNYLDQIKNGMGQNWKSYSVNERLGGKNIRKLYNLNENEKIWSIFTSSTDEMASSDSKYIFDTQIDWIEETIRLAIKHNQKLFIRIHPNTGGKVSTGVNSGALITFNKTIEKYICYRNLIHFILPDDEVNSYDLMEITDIGITYGSTVGLEMACMGKKVVVCTEAFYDNLSFVWTLRNKQKYEDLLLFATRLEDAMETKRESLRFAYYYYYRASSIKFPYVKMPDPHNGILNYTTLDDLLPGKEKNLDRICNIILNNEEIIPTSQYSEEEIEKNKILESKYLLNK